MHDDKSCHAILVKNFSKCRSGHFDYPRRRRRSRLEAENILRTAMIFLNYASSARRTSLSVNVISNSYAQVCKHQSRNETRCDQKQEHENHDNEKRQKQQYNMKEAKAHAQRCTTTVVGIEQAGKSWWALSQSGIWTPKCYRAMRKGTKIARARAKATDPGMM